MSGENLVALILAGVLAVYLVAAFLIPEKF
jgi:phage shock protein PspC (stress-responsive transcriptional regulator)